MATDQLTAASRRAVAAALISVVAIGIALLSTRAQPLILVGVVGVTVIILVGLGARRSAIGAGIGSVQYCGLCVLAISVLLITFNNLRVQTHLTASDLVIVLAAAVSLLALIADRAPIPHIPGWLTIGSAGLLVAGYVASWSAADPGADAVASAEFAIALLGVPLLLAFAAPAPARIRLLARLWVVSAMVNAVVALADFSHVTSIGISVAGRPSGFTVHPNHLGISGAMAIPIALFFVTKARRKVEASLYLAGLAIIGLGVLVSGSRAAFLAAVAGVLLFSALGHHLWKRVILLGIGAAAVLFSSSLLMGGDQSPSTTNPFIAFQRLADPVAVAGTNISNATRLDYYAIAVTDFSRHPLTGVGFEVVRDAHDIYFQLLQAGGVLALISFGIFAIGSFRLGLRLCRAHNISPEMKNLAAALTVSLLIWLLSGLVQNLIYDRFLYLPTGLLIALSIATKRRATRGEAVAIREGVLRAPVRLEL